MEIVKIDTEEKNSLMKVAAHVLGKTVTDIEGVVESEMTYLEQRVGLSPALLECSPKSLLMCIRHAIRDNVSLDETAGLVYLYPQSIKAADGKYHKVATYELSPNGRLSLARQTGNILDHKQPKLIRDKSGKVTGGSIEFLKPSLPTPRWEKFEFDEFEIARWAKFSSVKNGKWDNNLRKKVPGKPNALYTNGTGGGIDEGFMKAKILKHALKNMGTNVSEVRGKELIPLPDTYEAPLTVEENQKTKPENEGGAEDLTFEVIQ